MFETKIRDDRRLVLADSVTVGDQDGWTPVDAPHALMKPSNRREFFGVYELDGGTPDDIARFVT